MLVMSRSQRIMLKFLPIMLFSIKVTYCAPYNAYIISANL